MPDGEAKAAKLTKYTILEAQSAPDREDPDFRVTREVEASGAAAARQAAFDSLPADRQQRGATLVAVPTRSWVPKRRELARTPRSVEV